MCSSHSWHFLLRSRTMADPSLTSTCSWHPPDDGSTPPAMGPLGIDYIYAYHCGFREHGWLFFPCLLVWGSFITYLMGHTADAYFSPTLATLSDKVRPRGNWGKGEESRKGCGNYSYYTFVCFLVVSNHHFKLSHPLLLPPFLP